jgi:hydroxyethylthiazole kinase-like sugar kinase family protein
MSLLTQTEGNGTAIQGNRMTIMPLVGKQALARPLDTHLSELDDELPASVAKAADGSLVSVSTRVTKVAQETSDDN